MCIFLHKGDNLSCLRALDIRTHKGAKSIPISSVFIWMIGMAGLRWRARHTHSFSQTKQHGLWVTSGLTFTQHEKKRGHESGLKNRPLLNTSEERKREREMLMCPWHKAFFHTNKHSVCPYVNIDARLCKYQCDMFISVFVCVFTYGGRCISTLAAGSAPWEDYWF